MSPTLTFPIAADPHASTWRRHLMIPTLVAPLPLLGLSWAGMYSAAIIVTAAMAGLTYYLLRRCDGSRRVTFTIEGGTLRVRGDVFADSFFLSDFDLEKAETLDLTRDRTRALRWKNLGTGMPGYYSGEYTLANGENAVVFVSDKSRVLYLPRTAASQPAVLLSVDDPARVRECLRAAR